MPKEELSHEKLLIIIADLRQKIEALEEAQRAPLFDENFYKTLANSSQAGVYIMQDRKFKFVNPHIQEYAGYSEKEMLGMNPVSIIHPVDRALARKSAVRMLKGQRFSPYEFRIITGDGRIKWILESVTSIYYSGKRAVLGNSMNITEQKEARTRLEELEALESSILDAIPHAVIGLHNRLFIFANNAVRSVFGWRPEELIGKSVRQFYRSDEESDEIAERFYQALETQRTYAMEYPCRRKDGVDIICMVRASRIGETLRERRIVVTYEDITERRKAEEELERSREQLRNLSSHLQSVREQERTQIAREIHDELGQSLTALKMDLTWMGKRLQENPPLLEKTKVMSKLIDATIEIIHRITAELRPGLLDDFGLVAAMDWLANQFQKRAGIRCKARLEADDLALDKEVSTAIFRIFQETLTNVARHAEATRVDVSLIASGDKLILEVIDDGRGITKKQMNDPHAFGIIGMRERALPWGGEVFISGGRDKGTTVRLTIPLKRAEAGS